MKQSVKSYKRVVVKLGSSFLCSQGKDSRVLVCSLEPFAAQIAGLINEGKQVVVVSSGAIAAGMAILDFKTRPKEVSTLQAVAAVGQHLIMSEYQKAFSDKGLNCAQVLLTWEDFNDDKRQTNAKNTLLKLFSLGVVPIINENDTVSTDEIKFGDNDRLSALVASLVEADLLIILSDVDGLLDRDKKKIDRVEAITSEIKSLACPTRNKTCVGGMVTKIEAASISTGSNIACVIANGAQRDVIKSSVHEPGIYGTLFLPKSDLTEKKIKIKFRKKPKGSIVVDDGAKAALFNKKSLLSVGITDAEGDFSAGDIVSIKDKNRIEFARGRAKVSMVKVEGVKGRHFDKEIIHRDDIVIL